MPVVNIGDRQEGRERGANVLDVDYDATAIAEAIARQRRHGRYASQAIYGHGDAGERIAADLATMPLTYAKRIAY